MELNSSGEGKRKNPGKPHGREALEAWNLLGKLGLHCGLNGEHLLKTPVIPSLDLGSQDCHHTGDSYWSHEATYGCYLYRYVVHPNEHIHPISHEHGQPSGPVLIYIMPWSKGLMECKSLRIILDRTIENLINSSGPIIPRIFHGSTASNCGV